MSVRSCVTSFRPILSPCTPRTACSGHWGGTLHPAESPWHQNPWQSSRIATGGEGVGGSGGSVLLNCFPISDTDCYLSYLMFHFKYIGLQTAVLQSYLHCHRNDLLLCSICCAFLLKVFPSLLIHYIISFAAALFVMFFQSPHLSCHTTAKYFSQ